MKSAAKLFSVRFWFKLVHFQPITRHSSLITRLGGLACLSLLIAGCQTSPVQKSEAIELFNGKNFDGWTFYMKNNADPMQTWSITDGVIHCTGKPSGYARTIKSYHDYKLTVEWRFVKVARHADNTGVLVHMQLPEKVWPMCIECQGQYHKQGDFWLHSGAAADGFSGDGIKSVHAPMAVPPNEPPPGEWGVCQVVAKGNTVEITVNGKLMNKIMGCNLSSGFIGLQSEGAEIEVRKVTLEPLP